MTAVDVHMPDLAGPPVEPPAWEPATFVLGCASGHTWGSTGQFHFRSRTCAPNQPTCPRRNCGRPRTWVLAEWGPHRRGVVETPPS